MLSRHMCKWVKCVLCADFQKTNHCEDSGNITYVGKVGVQQIILSYVPLILKKNASIVLGNKSVSEPGLCLLCSISQSICNEQQQSRAQLEQLRKLTCLVVCRVWYSLVLYYCCCCFVLFFCLTGLFFQRYSSYVGSCKVSLCVVKDTHLLWDCWCRSVKYGCCHCLWQNVDIIASILLLAWNFNTFCIGDTNVVKNSVGES